MKKYICLLFVFLFVALVPFSVSAIGTMTRTNNVYSADTRFTISDGGDATITLSYEGYPNITTGATISVKIEKRVLFAFWDEVVSRTFTVTGEQYYTSLIYQLDKKGTYKCTVEYVISGAGGADDVITYEAEQKYE